MSNRVIPKTPLLLAALGLLGLMARRRVQR